MKKINKKLILIIMILTLAMTNLGSIVLAEHSELPEIAALEDTTENSSENVQASDEDLKGVNSASKNVLQNVTKREKRLAELKIKYNDDVYAKVAYYLEVAQKYSLPICFIGIAMGCFNFLIVGNKKLDKKEQGFGWIVGFTIGLVVFNVIPLLFALIVAGK